MSPSCHVHEDTCWVPQHFAYNTAHGDVHTAHNVLGTSCTLYAHACLATCIQEQRLHVCRDFLGPHCTRLCPNVVNTRSGDLSSSPKLSPVTVTDEMPAIIFQGCVAVRAVPERIHLAIDSSAGRGGAGGHFLYVLMHERRKSWGSACESSYAWAFV